MRELPIPDSNMYKYVALSGVAIIIVTLVFAVSELFDINDQRLHPLVPQDPDADGAHPPTPG